MAPPNKDGRPVIIVKRRKKGEHAHHGGAWKVAYADFVTAMMAFFLVMWLVTAMSKEQRAAVFEYFKNPSMEPGKSVKPAPGQMGPGGASTSPINLGGSLDALRARVSPATDVGATAAPARREADQQDSSRKTKTATQAELDSQAAAALKAQEHQKLESLMAELREAVNKSQALEPFKDQLLLDITPEGVRIQIVDAQNRPMFDLGSARLRDYTRDILRELTPYLNSVPNRISLTGHTDIRAYTGQGNYSNWELSADRANAARRALTNAGLPDDKIARVVGLASSVLFDKANPQNPINRRISIVVMTKQAEEEALKTDIANATEAGATPAAGPAAAAAGVTPDARTDGAPSSTTNTGANSVPSATINATANSAPGGTTNVPANSALKGTTNATANSVPSATPGAAVSGGTTAPSTPAATVQAGVAHGTIIRSAVAAAADNRPSS